MSLKMIKVVLPTAKELEGRTIIASDFAVACGVRFREFTCEEDGNLKLRSGWNENDFNLNCAYAATSTVVCKRRDGKNHFRIKAKFPSNDAKLNFRDDASLECHAGDHALAALFKFENPESINMTVETNPQFNNRMGVVKVGDKTLTVPQTYAGSNLSKKLESMYKKGQLQQVGTFTIDGLATAMNQMAGDNCDALNQPIDPVVCPRFTIDGVDYVRKNFAKAKLMRRPDGEGDFTMENGRFSNGTIASAGKPCWFKCEPLTGVKNLDGSITCLNAVLPLQLEEEEIFEALVENEFLVNPTLRAKFERGEGVNMHVPTLSGGKFLNQVFLPEILQSVGLDLEQVRQERVVSNL